MGIAAGHLSRIENGRRPPTESVAAKADAVFPDRRGWFAEYYEESKSWTPPGFRDWPEYENKSARLSVWAPGIIHGLLQTGDYARALLRTFPEAGDEIIGARLKSRMERQARVFERDDPPRAWFIVDHAALYRLTGSADIMAAQMNRLAEVTRWPNVTLQVHPAIAHPATRSGFLVTDAAAYTEHVSADSSSLRTNRCPRWPACLIRCEPSRTGHQKVSRSSRRRERYGLAKEQLLRSQRRRLPRGSVS
jgi:hypothetical protein